MKDISRRDFVKTVAIGGASLSLGSAVFYKPLEALASGKYDIGQCKSVKITCVSELGWYSNEILLKQIMATPKKIHTNQWIIPWDPRNAAGSSSLIDVELLDGTHHKFLLDTGWNRYYMDQAFKREGVDKMLKNGEIEFLIISHEHLDHYWGLETTLKYNPKIKIIIPSTFYPEGMYYLHGATFDECNTANRIAHQGELVKLRPGEINKLYPGVAAVNFDLPIIVRVRGEESLYFNVKDKGMVCVTGCCHQNTITFGDFAVNNIEGGDNMYGIYGGLHIAPFGPMNPKREFIVKEMGKFNFKKVACNHCTGAAAVQKMIDLGYPVVRGTARFGSQSDLYIGNGDVVEF
ncbi:MAG: MBL fold metallo-hydrolase [Deltaproteobacteria bacterium]|nr:MBL fold metallo-hydrolase [Deltaproteobacteria bacterium]